MLWKILSGIAAVCLAVGVFFSYLNKGALQEERALEDRSKQNLSETDKKTADLNSNKDRKTKDLADLSKQRDDAKAQVAKTNEDITAKQSEVEKLKKELDEVTKQVATVEDQIQKAGDIEKLAAQVEDLQKQLKDTEAALANQEQQKALAEKELVAVQGDIARLRETEKRQNAGIVEPGFTARVAQAYPTYGFVVLNKGNSNGMFARAALEVKRNNNVIAQLTVRDVEPTMSVADLVPGSLSSGQSIMSGDIVVASSKQPKLTEEPPAAPVSTTPAAPGANAPPGNMAAPTVPGGDMFGAPPAGSAPAPAAPGADPFGAPSPPAAAPGAAAGGDGTPAKPRTDDPFAPAAAGAAPAASGAGKPATADPFAPPAK